MSPTLIASLIGVLATTQIHIAKGMQKYGIGALQNGSASGDPDSGGSDRDRRRRKIIYFSGLILNNLAFFWVLIANMYAPTCYYTSAFGFGLVVLMIFSEGFLHEKHTPFQHIGAVVIAVGTLLIGMVRTAADIPGMEQIHVETVLIFIGVYFPVLFFLLFLALLYRHAKPLGVIFGMITGCAASIDPILKGIGQSTGIELRILPGDLRGRLFFLGSFIFGGIALGFTQFGFYKKAKASTLIAFHNITLITVPIFLMKISLPGFTLDHFQVLGLTAVVTGIALMFSETTFALLFQRNPEN